MGDPQGLAGVQRRVGGQDAGIEPRGVQAGKGGQLFRAGGEEDVSLCGLQKRRRLLRALHRDPGCFRRALLPQEAAEGGAGGFTGRLDVLRHLHRIGVGGVDAEGVVW